MVTNKKKPLFSVYMSLPSRYIQLPEKYKNRAVREYLDELLNFYDEYFWLIHVLPFNFITHRQWEQFDIQWREAIMAKLEEAGDNWAMAVLDLTTETSDYVNSIFNMLKIIFFHSLFGQIL